MSVDADRVRIDRERGTMADISAYDPELVDRPDYYNSVHGWCGTAPYQGAGYGFRQPYS